MIENNQGLSSHNEDDINASFSKEEDDLQNDSIIVQGTTFTKEEIEEANKPQPNVILAEVPGMNTGNYRDSSRVGPRANEASDANDSNSGGISAGGGKGVSQS